jgi:hypothetical protein
MIGRERPCGLKNLKSMKLPRESIISEIGERKAKIEIELINFELTANI